MAKKNPLKAVSAFALLLAVSLPALAQNDGYDLYGHALVQDSEGWVYIDRDSRPILRPYIFDNGPDYFEEGLARFVENGKIGFHDKALNVVIPAQYDFAFPFEGGVAKTGMGCRTREQGEHTSVYCDKWRNISKPGG